MARQVYTTVHVVVRVEERETDSAGGFGSVGRVLHELAYDKEWLSGNDAVGKCDRVHADAVTYSTTPTDVDLTAALDGFGVSSSFVGGVAVLAVVNDATSGSGHLAVGGDANAFAGFVGAANDLNKVYAGGLLLMVAPLTDVVPVADTGDIVQIAASAATIAGRHLVVGRSA